jgi:hypothetical protein
MLIDEPNASPFDSLDELDVGVEEVGCNFAELPVMPNTLRVVIHLGHKARCTVRHHLELKNASFSQSISNAT